MSEWSQTPPESTGTFWALPPTSNEGRAVVVVKYGPNAPLLAWIPEYAEPEEVQHMEGWTWWTTPLVPPSR